MGIFAGSYFEMGANLITLETRFQCTQTKQENVIVPRIPRQVFKPNFVEGQGKLLTLLITIVLAFSLARFLPHVCWLNICDLTIPLYELCILPCLLLLNAVPR